MPDQIRWYPNVEDGGQTVGYFRYEDRLCIPESQEADEKIFRKVVVLTHKPAASTEVSTTMMKPGNERELRARWAPAWAAFNGEEIEAEGTPLDELRWLTEENRIFLKLSGVGVVEQLAGLADARCQALGFGWRKNRERAQNYLKEQNEKMSRADQIERQQKKDRAA
jgi:hypothetical protein